MTDHRHIESFEDDPSSALGLTHGYQNPTIMSASPNDAPIVTPATQDELELREEAARRFQTIVAPIAAEELANASGPRAEVDPNGAIIPTNAGAYDAVERRARELQAEGMSMADAVRIATEEAPSEAPEQSATDAYLGDSITALMHRKRPAGATGGGGGGRRREAKKGTKMCSACGLERKVCGCYSGRNEFTGARVSSQVKGALAQADIAAGEIIEAVVQAALAAGGPRMVRAVIDRIVDVNTLRRDDCARCVELPKNLVCPMHARVYEGRHDPAPKAKKDDASDESDGSDREAA